MPKLYLYVLDDPENIYGCKYSFSTKLSDENSDDLLGESEVSDNAAAFLLSLERFNKELMDEILAAACKIVESHR